MPEIRSKMKTFEKAPNLPKAAFCEPHPYHPTLKFFISDNTLKLNKIALVPQIGQSVVNKAVVKRGHQKPRLRLQNTQKIRGGSEMKQCSDCKYFRVDSNFVWDSRQQSIVRYYCTVLGYYTPVSEIREDEYRCAIDAQWFEQKEEKKKNKR